MKGYSVSAASKPLWTASMIFAVLRQSPTATQGQSSAAESPSDRALSGRQPTGDDEGVEAGEGFLPAFSLRSGDGVARADGKDFVAGPQFDAKEGHAAQQEHAGAPFHILGELRQHLDHGDGAALRRRGIRRFRSR